MDRGIFIPTALLGVVLVIIHCAKCHKNNNKVNVGVIVNLLLLSAGVVGGLVLGISAFYKPIQNYLASLDFYVFISGVTVLAVSIQGIMRDL